MSTSDKRGFECPLPLSDHPNVLLAHGGGGRLMHQLIDDIFGPAFASPDTERDHDAAVLHLPAERLAFTTDSYVVDPLFFPGGDIGTLAVYGTVNDLAMSGARPLYLSTGFIVEEGFAMEQLCRVAQSMAEAAKEANVRIVTGDTKVVDRGHGHGLFVNTAGVGAVEHNAIIAPVSVRPGDAVILSGDVGRHGVAVMACREGLAFETDITSDCAPLAAPIMDLLTAGVSVHCLRDLTRGGLGTALVEIATTAGLHVHIEQNAVPVTDAVRGACELLGFDPMFVANEGRFVAFVPQADADRTIDVLRRSIAQFNGGVIGQVKAAGEGMVTMTTAIGAEVIVDMLSGEQLPRIC